MVFNQKRKEVKILLKKFLVITFVALAISIFIASAKAAEYQFKEQDVAKATEECDDASPCKPELVPTQDDAGNINFALLETATPNADSLIGDGDWCPARHCTEYLNDGFYNNCRSWITASGGPEAWAEVDLGDVYLVKKVGIGSDHCGNYQDRFAKDFKILVATEYNEDSRADSWQEVYDNQNGAEVHETLYFEFPAVAASHVRIFVETGGGGVRIDELEVYGTALTETAVYPQGKVTATWGYIKN
jgi:hypothetical protein